MIIFLNDFYNFVFLTSDHMQQKTHSSMPMRHTLSSQRSFGQG